MAGGFGLSFDPSASQQGGPGAPPSGGAKPSGSPIQQAIQYLSLRMPKVAGARTPVDPRLLAGSPQAAQGPSPRASAVAESVLRSMQGPEQAQGLSVPSQSPQAPPAPSFGFPSQLPEAPPVVPGMKPEPTKTFGPGPSMAPGVAPSMPAPAQSSAPSISAPQAPQPTPAPRFGFGEGPPAALPQQPSPQPSEQVSLPPDFQTGLMALIRQMAGGNKGGFTA